ncbi:hypothetical protein APR04_000219 [Promicromonospora umidemergens]|uniref:Uncharacterized protein n=1 Tax=Promicromonospora umidemergens TaxID=629679 RepID=A0ABP8X8U8_9MICO|nr:hypothetical protein [Promicromonospora umidemergens]MCP2281330.1 hypothetical protein [Promicromonospora umidemergens]
MFGFSDYAEYRRNEQELDRRAEQSRAAREHATRQDVAARRTAVRTTERTARTTDADRTRPRVA